MSKLWRFWSYKLECRQLATPGVTPASPGSQCSGSTRTRGTTAAKPDRCRAVGGKSPTACTKFSHKPNKICPKVTENRVHAFLYNIFSLGKKNSLLLEYIWKKTKQKKTHKKKSPQTNKKPQPNKKTQTKQKPKRNLGTLYPGS